MEQPWPPVITVRSVLLHLRIGLKISPRKRELQVPSNLRELQSVHTLLDRQVRPDVQQPYTPGFAKTARTTEAHRLAMNAAKGIAVIGTKFLSDNDFAKQVKTEFDKLKKDVEQEQEVGDTDFEII